MKPIYLNLAGALALTFGIAACVPAPPPPAPTPTPTPTLTPAPKPAPVPVAQTPVYRNWLDAPQTPGDWSYAGASGVTQANFGAPGSPAVFTMTCIDGSRAVRLERAHPAPVPALLRVRTETSDRTFTAHPLAGSRDGAVFVQLAARDPLLDAMAVTKGRFAVETESMATLYLPSWTEVSRVIEDCR